MLTWHISKQMHYLNEEKMRVDSPIIEELRIGNLVHAIERDEKTDDDILVETEVTSLEKAEFRDRINGESHDFFLTIPITEKLLDEFDIKGKHGEHLCGQVFVGNKDIYHYQNGFYYVLDSVENNYGEWVYAEVKIDFIHQLQNIYFDSFGEELKKKS